MIPTGGVSQLSGCCPPYGYHFIIGEDYFLWISSVPAFMAVS